MLVTDINFVQILQYPQLHLVFKASGAVLDMFRKQLHKTDISNDWKSC